MLRRLRIAALMATAVALLLPMYFTSNEALALIYAAVAIIAAPTMMVTAFLVIVIAFIFSAN